MKEKELAVPGSTLNIIIQSLFRKNMPDLALQLLDDLVKRGIFGAPCIVYCTIC